MTDGKERKPLENGLASESETPVNRYECVRVRVSMIMIIISFSKECMFDWSHECVKSWS